MNIHPIFVHFPVALLTLYGIMEVLQFRVLSRSRSWNVVKATFLILGTISSFVALQTGDMAEALLGGTRLIEMHSTLAAITAWFFSALSVIYATRMVNTGSARVKDWFWNTRYVRPVWKILSAVSDSITEERWLLALLGLVGLVLISLTGALGGAVAYGPDVDPIVSFAYHLFF